MTAPQLGFWDKPVRAGAFTPRPYQIDGDRGVDLKLSEFRSTLVVQATGCGKTVLFCMQAAKRHGGLVLVHRDSLATQAMEKLQFATGEHVALEKAERHAFGSRYVVGTVQTLKGARLKRFAERFADIPLVIVDEAHRATAASYRTILEAFPAAKILGVTATPDRTDGVALGSVFESVAHEYDILTATADGWLTETEYHPIHAELDLDKIGRKGKDLDQSQLDDAVAAIAGDTARAIIDHARDKRLIVFSPGVKAAHATAGALNRLVPGCAAAIDADTEQDIRDSVQRRHRAGELRYLVNCDIYGEGYDDSDLDGIMDTAKSLSRIKVMQRLGRSTRPHTSANVDAHATPAERVASMNASPKPRALWYDLVCNASRHNVVGPTDILGGKMPDEVRAETKKILEEKGGTVDAAKREAEERVEERARAKRAHARALKARTYAGEVKSIFALTGLEYVDRAAMKRGVPPDPITPKQMRWLNWKRIPVPDACTKRQAMRLISTEKEREANGLVSLAGVEWLRRYGLNGWKMPRKTAIAVREEIVRNGHMLPRRERLDELLSMEVGANG